MSAIDLLAKLSHHAYLLIGASDTRDELISILEKKHTLIAQGNPDFYIRNFETLTIDDARELKVLHSSRPVGTAQKKIFVLTMNGITIEAQNALLKLLEEPAEYAHFFLIVPSAHLLLPTVKSRMLEITTGEGRREKGERRSRDAEVIEEAEKFLKLSLAKRLDYVKDIVDAISKEKKTKQDAIGFLNAIEEVVYVDYKKRSDTEARNQASPLEAIETARNYLNDRAPSVKMLLEYVALNV
jgi:DNA polymerase III delta prime subunit